MADRKKRPRSKQQALPPQSALAIIIGLIVVVAALWWVTRGDRSEEIAFEDRLAEMAAQRGVDDRHIAADDPIQKVDDIFVRTWQIQFPNRPARDGFIGDLEIESSRRKLSISVPEDLAADVLALRVDRGGESFDLRLGLVSKVAEKAPPPTPTAAPTVEPTPQPTKKREPAPGARGRLAILLDDGGQNLDLVPAAAALPAQVGFALLPFLPKTESTANALHNSGHEIWLHLPMEPENYPRAKPGPGALLMSMSESDLRTAVHAGIDNVPHAVGVNNHMGSKVTADLRTMTWIMQELKARGMMFIDSRTTVRTVAEEAARAQGVPTARRHVFLDNERDVEAVRRQLAEAVYRCRLDGEAIAIGHMDRVTIGVLTAELPGLSKRGADLVKPSDLVR